MPNPIDIAGQRFGRLVAIEKTDQRASGGNIVWRCRCECGGERVTAGRHLRQGLTKSCGCLHLETAAAHIKRVRNPRPRLRHGHSRPRTPIYRVWCGMIARCHRPGSGSYPRYGGRGITVCERWQTFENFLADMGERPAGKSIDRINNDSNYEPGNCRWATPKEQRANRRPVTRRA
jgi:hypothetical protein